MKKIVLNIIRGLIIMIAIVISYHYIDRERIFNEQHEFGVELVSKEQITKLIENKERKALTPIYLEYEEEKIPYDSFDKVLYVSQSMQTKEWQGTFRSAKEEYTLYLLADKMLKEKEKAIANAHRFRFYLVSEEKYMTGTIVFSGLPTVCIRGVDNDSLADVVINDPESENGISVIHTKCTFHKRGSASAGYDKANYKISLCDENKEKVKKSLLGMRKDDDWILTGLYTDKSKIREKMAYTLWKEINDLEEHPIASSNVEYVEVFLNNEYMGIYLLMEPIDGKQMDMAPGDQLYKIRRWELPDYGNFDICEDWLDLYNYDGGKLVSIKYPKSEEDDYSWEPLRNYMEYFLTDESLHGDGTVPRMDMDNMLDYYLFCQLTNATDNLWKNVYLAAYLEDDGNYTFYKTVWDLNYTWGDTWDSPEENLWTKFSYPDGTILSIADYDTYAQEDPEGMKNLAYKKWQQWKDAGITAEHLQNMADEYSGILVHSGAFARDKQKWPDCKDNSSTAKIKKWIKLQFLSIDKYFEDTGER